jgi:hypothetical protein
VRKRSYWLFILSLFGTTWIGNCAQAVFSQDEQSVFLITPKGVLELNLTTKEVQAVPTPAKFDPSSEYGVSLSNAGDLLFAGNDEIAAYNFERNAWVTVCRASRGTVCTDVACNPADGSLIFEINDQKNSSGYWYMPKDASVPVKLRLRRISHMSGFAFDTQGRLYFGYNGDLWTGAVCSLPDDEARGQWICGIRIAPVADLETSIGTPSNQGVQETASSGEVVYVHLRRLGGSGWGQIATLTAPAIKFVDGEAEDDSYEKRLELYQNELRSIRLLGENGSYGYLCASRSGHKIFYRAQDAQDQKMKIWLVTEGKTEELGAESLLGTVE